MPLPFVTKPENGHPNRLLTYPFQVHVLHRLIHTLDDTGHATCDLLHGDGRFDAGRDGVDPRTQAKEVEGLVLLANDVGCIDSGTFGVALLQSLRKLGVRSIETSVCRAVGERERNEMDR